jgi:hypothetical protein
MKTIGAKIDMLHELREQKRGLEEQVKVIAQSMQTLEDDLIKQLDAQGVSKSTGLHASVSISTSTVPVVEDWDAFYKFLHRHKYYHLLERRPAVAGCRELLELKGKIPGVTPFVKRKLNLRSI